ncbi:response regulator [Cohnella silvisoli]|uniref:Response regulator n=1 Tax=Cohnella silvisoli TaxID=2873699 RepID=A0ABV1KUP8_9BACL|nr:response regulator [Cohnella silvisoli]MCD9023115.1 response regulator [Cohnella silvisoli]
MIKVLLVDDEKIMRIGIKMMIPWEEHGFEWVGGAEDGLEALGMIEQHRPDIIITDLMMPKMSGLELIQRLNKDPLFHGRVIVLSNYDDYELVRDAMKLGAVDYLLKLTLKPEELLDVLGKAVIELIAEKEVKEIHRMNTIVMRESLLQSRKNFLKELLHDDLLLENGIAAKAQKLNVTFGNAPSFLLYLTLDQVEKILRTGKWADKQLLIFSIQNIISEIINEFSQAEFTEIGFRDFVIIIPESDKNGTDHRKLQLAKQISSMLKIYLDLDVSVLISSVFKGLPLAREVFVTCKKAAEMRFYHSEPMIAHARETVFDHLHFAKLNPSYHEELKKFAQSGNTNGLLKVFDGFLDAAGKERFHPSLVLKMALFAIEEWELAGADTEQPQVLSEPYKKRLIKAETIGEFKDAFVKAVLALSENSLTLSSKKYRKEIRDIIDFMLKNLDQKITLRMIANHVNLNESYLTRLFKLEIGKTIIHFLNDLRMEKAQELLKNPDLSVRRVSEMVGIPDPLYFNRIFNKVHGQSPSDFKRNCTKSRNSPYFSRDY